MVRFTRSLLIALTFVSSSITLKAAPIKPEAIKQEVESSISYYSYDSTRKTVYTVAQEVATSDQLDVLVKHYTLEQVLLWQNGQDFVNNLKSYADATGQAKLVAWSKVYLQKKLKEVWLGDFATLATPTTQHALIDQDNTLYVTSNLSATYQQQLKTVAPLLCSLVKEEKILNDKGYCVFFHGQRWEYLFGEKLYTDLWALTKNKARSTTYLFPHVRIQGLNPEETYGKLNRTTLVQNYGYDNNYGFIYPILLFTTNFLFGNYKNASYSSPLSYFLTDNNIGSVHFSIYDIFSHYNIPHLYTKYSKEIQDLQTHFDAARTFGTLLRIAIPKKLVNDYCFGQDLSRGTDTLAYLEGQQTIEQRCNYEAFCIVMLDEAMNPEGRILIKAYHCAETTEWQKFEAGYEQLIKKLAADINPPANKTTSVKKAKTATTTKKK